MFNQNQITWFELFTGSGVNDADFIGYFRKKERAIKAAEKSGAAYALVNEWRGTYSRANGYDGDYQNTVFEKGNKNA